MGLVHSFIDLLLHLDKHLSVIIAQFGIWTYVILFLIIFVETGLVIMPFLPGDSLLFVAGTFASRNDFNIGFLLVTLTVAAILGDTVNYLIGYTLGPKVFSQNNSRFFKKEYLEKTRGYFEKYGSKTIILARFIPIVRTFAPFVAGIGSMRYGQFISYNIIGGIVWVGALTLAGYFFGNLAIVREHFETVVLVIIALSVIPGVIEFIRHRNEKPSAATTNYSDVSKTFHKQHLSE